MAAAKSDAWSSQPKAGREGEMQGMGVSDGTVPPKATHLSYTGRTLGPESKYYLTPESDGRMAAW